MTVLKGGPHGTTETGAAYVEAGQNAEANHPARLLGVAQAAIRDALLLGDLHQVRAHLTETLARIKPTEVPA